MRSHRESFSWSKRAGLLREVESLMRPVPRAWVAPVAQRRVSRTSRRREAEAAPSRAERDNLGDQVISIACEEISVMGSRDSHEPRTANCAGDALPHPKRHDLVGVPVDHQGGHVDVGRLGERVEVVRDQDPCRNDRNRIGDEPRNRRVRGHENKPGTPSAARHLRGYPGTEGRAPKNDSFRADAALREHVERALGVEVESLLGRLAATRSAVPAILDEQNAESARPQSTRNVDAGRSRLAVVVEMDEGPRADRRSELESVNGNAVSSNKRVTLEVLRVLGGADVRGRKDEGARDRPRPAKQASHADCEKKKA